MTETRAETRFAPAGRLGLEEIRRSFSELSSELPYDLMLDLVPSMAFVLNDRRQVLFANSAALSGLGLGSEEVLGARPGELVSCVHSREMPGGCGTAEACAACGAVGAVMEALATGAKAMREARILSSKGDTALDLKVTATPLRSRSGRFLAVTLEDIGDTKRRELLERIFFHDVMNSVASLQACAILLGSGATTPERAKEYVQRLDIATRRLGDEISQQRELFCMERGELVADPVELDLGTLARELAREVEATDYARGKALVLRAREAGPLVLADRALLGRVIVNMLKNAFEASEAGESVELEVFAEDGRAGLSVRNGAFIPREAQLQVFQRSFSTKGRGRGIGTYSMKVLTEEYLGGEIGFTSDEARGTEFKLLLPLAPPEEA